MNERLTMLDAAGETYMKLEQAKALLEIILEAYFTTARQFKDCAQTCYNMHTLLDLTLDALAKAKETERIAEKMLDAGKA